MSARRYRSRGCPRLRALAGCRCPEALRCPRLPQAVSGAEALERVRSQPALARAVERVQGVVALQLVSLGDPGGGTHGLTGTGPAGTHLASPDRRAGRGVQGSREPVRSAAVDPGLGGGLAVTELLARVGGSSVSLNCPCADQGGRHVDMVVGADHRGRGGVGVWRDAATSRLMHAARSRLAFLFD